MTREEELKMYAVQSNINWKMKMVDSHQICFRNALAGISREIDTLEDQYRNVSSELEQAISALRKAYTEVVSAEKASRREYANIDDYVNYIHPDYVSVDNGHGNTPGNTPVTSVKVEVDVDGVHMYVNI